MYSLTVSFSLPRFMWTLAPNLSSVASVMFCATDMVSTRPSPLRSSVTKPMPALIASSGW